MSKSHRYQVKIEWTGNLGEGTRGYKSYARSHRISAPGKEPILASSDPAFRGDPMKYNPEEMLVASISTCHMLWFLHLASVNDIIIVDYQDHPEGLMQETSNGGGFFEQVLLKPSIVVNHPVENDKIEELHQQANKLCFIANSVKFPVLHQPEIIVKG